MTNDILELVKTLTDRDTKTLSQKGLKLSEECGELSKSILPYENAAGSLHKFIHKENIIDNCVDTILVALSIAYSLDCSNDAIYNAMYKKAMYWSSLQDNESSVNISRMPHEIHITVKQADSLAEFTYACISAGVKPIVLDLHKKDTSTIKDIMTSSVFYGNSSQAYAEMKRIAGILEIHGFNVVRGKIEAPPFHPAVPNNVNKFKHEHGRYFESHIEVLLDDKKNNKMLENWVQQYPLHIHMSNNVFKATETISTMMLTYRKYDGTIESFKADINKIRESLSVDGFSINGKEIIEYCLYDSSIIHDAEWISGN